MHFEKLIKNKYFWLSLIFVFALAVRFYKLGQVPFGFVNDEAAFGYNAYSLIKTGKDEYGQSWPLVFRSFGEGKMPVYFYLTIPSVLLFGLNEFSTRLPSALFGSLTVLLVFFLVKEISKSKKSSWPLFSAFILAAMPWHIHFSRAAFETNLSVFWAALASLLFFLFLKSSKNWQLITSLFCFTLSVFSYNAPRIFIPLWLAYLIWQYRRRLPLLKTFLLTFFLVVIPWLSLFFTQSSLNRFAGISIFNPQSAVMLTLEEKFRESRNLPLVVVRALHNKPTAYVLDAYRRYASHFDSGYLFFSGDPYRPRYRSPSTGQALWICFPFFFIGLYLLAKNKHWPIIIWLLLAPIASSITFETPSSFRSLLMVFPMAIAIGLGLSFAVKNIPAFMKPILLLIFVFNFGLYLDAYFIHAPMHEPYEWQGGYRELVQRVNQLMPDFDKALITDARGTAYIYFLFYNQYDPAKWQTQALHAVTAPDKFGFTTMNHLDNLYFNGETCPAKIPEDKVLYVCTQENNPLTGFVQIGEPVRFENNQPSFILLKKQSQDENNLSAQ